MNNNKAFWNNTVQAHIESDFYDVPSFLEGKSSLNSIEMGLLGDLNQKQVLHLQCHFGLDSISLARLGAQVSAMDFSEEAVRSAQELAQKCKQDVRFIEGDVLDFVPALEGTMDLVFASYGTIGWFGDLEKYASNVFRYLKPGGRFVFVEFHPVVHMFDDDFKQIAYPYDSSALQFQENGSYAGGKGSFEVTCWNHSIASFFQACMKAGGKLSHFDEHDYSPYPCFSGMVEDEPGKHVVAKFGRKLPYVYSCVWERN